MENLFKHDIQDELDINAILYSNFIRYENLRDLTINQFANSDANEVNIYLDMYSLIRPLYKRTILGDKTIFVSFILNLAAHMRNYYTTRHNVKTNIFIIFTSNTTILTKEVTMAPEWNITDRNKFFDSEMRNEILSINVNILKSIVPYFKDLYFINRTVEPSVIIQSLIDNKQNTCPDIIITSDKMSWQIPALNPDICIFKPLKKSGLDVSYCVNNNNVLYLWRTMVNKSNSEIESLLPSSMLSLYIAFTSFKARGMKSYFTPKVASDKIWNLCNSKKIQFGYNSPDAINKVLRAESKRKKELHEFEAFTNNLAYRYNLVDLRRLTNIYNTMPESLDTSWYYSKNDDFMIKEINDKYFIKNPINIISLMNIANP